MLHVKYIHILGFTVLLKDLRWKFFTVLLVEKQGEYYSALIFSFSSGLQIIFHSLYFLRHMLLLNLFLKAMAFSEPTLPFKSAVQEYMDMMPIRIMMCTMVSFSLQKQCLCTKCTCL